jgi:hypothetical protein
MNPSWDLCNRAKEHDMTELEARVAAFKGGGDGA